MAQYKVPQDVEADDKLLGPFSFRQFIYLAIAGGCIALAVALFQIFPLLAIIPAPIAIFFAVLALPLKKDQPMETYLVAILSYYFKPRTRFWIPGQRETTIQITAPKVTKKSPVRDISREEASHRLSFLAEVIDTEGRSIQNGSLNEDFVAEANNAEDIFDTANTNNLNAMIARDASERRAEIIDSMRDATTPAAPHQITHSFTQPITTSPATPPHAATTSKPPETQPAQVSEKPQKSTTQPSTKSTSKAPTKPIETPTETAAMSDLASDKDLSIQTISKEAKRRKSKQSKNEVYISLH